MKKNILTISAMLLGAVLFTGIRSVEASFSADGDVTVTGVTLGSGTIDMYITSGSTAETWSIASGSFTITNPGSSFKVGSSSSSAVSLTVTRGGAELSCENNSTPGTNTLSIPTEAGVYTVVPASSTCTVAASSGGGGGVGTSPSSPSTPAAETPVAAIPVPAVQTPAPAATTPTTGDSNLTAVKSEAAAVASGDKVALLSAVNKTANTTLESQYNTSIVSKITAGQSAMSAADREKILVFVTYGTQTTDSLGAGERGGVVNSFKEAFGKLPQTDADWEDVVKIANGRWPGQTDVAREKTAESNFKVIYKRDPVRSNAHDDAAVVVMAYGLRPRNRNLNSEKVAIKSYEAIFKRSPQTATAWDAVRAIAYSGATR